MIKAESLLLDAIEIEGRLRTANADAVARLAASMAEMGLQTPITVRSVAVPQPSGENDYRTILVAGLHRLEAARKLGWDYIQAVVWIDASEADARLWEIAENLHRADLTVQERSDQVAEWIRLTEEKAAAEAQQAISRQVAAKPSLGRPPGGRNAASRVLGIPEKEVRRSQAIASIAPEAKTAAAEAGVKTQAALLKVAAEPTPEKQVAKVADLKKRAEDRKVIHKAGDDIVQRDASDDAAEMILDFVPELKMPELLSYLDACGAGRLAKAIRREIKIGRRHQTEARPTH